MVAATIGLSVVTASTPITTATTIGAVNARRPERPAARVTTSSLDRASATLSGATAPTTFQFPEENGTGTRFDPQPNPGVDNAFTEKEFPPDGFFPYAGADDFVMGKLSAADLSVVMEAIAQRRD